MASEDKPDIGQYKIHFQDSLGRGKFGIVYKATNIETKETVAVKLLKPAHARLRYINDEIEIMKTANHPNLLRYIDDYEGRIDEAYGKQEFWLVSEFCSLGNLADYACNFLLCTEHKLHIAKQLASALAYIHNQKPHFIAHMDIKPMNILFSKLENFHVLKLSDFNVYRIMESEIRTSNSSISTIADAEIYLAPECFDENEWNKSNISGYIAIDVFAAAIIYYQIILTRPGDGISCKGVEDNSIGKAMSVNRKRRFSRKMQPVSIDSHETALIKSFKTLIKSMMEFD